MTHPKPLEGSCHCQSLKWTFTGPLESATACNCTSCRRWGGLWAYGVENESVFVQGASATYVRGPHLEYHFCPVCACVAYWKTQQPNESGKRAMAVNLRLTEPDAIAHLPIDHFEGLHSFEDLPRDSRCVRDLWF
jgi:hypothetical protein